MHQSGAIVAALGGSLNFNKMWDIRYNDDLRGITESHDNPYHMVPKIEDLIV